MLIADPVLDFDELYVVSDIHLGGSKRELQIFASAPQFEGLVNYLINRPCNSRVGLIINGDFIDFLAQPSNDMSVAYFDPHGAKQKLDQIFSADGFEPVWSALQKLLKTPNRTLTINIGNHDLELALPWVREYLCYFLTNGDDLARSRLRVETDGVGILCRVGNAKVLCVHGNDVDPWNSVDQGELSRIARDLVRGGKFEPWTPNGGSKFVIDVINELKQNFHFVDLLKPEGVAVFDFLASLGAKLADKVGDVAAAKALMTIHQTKMAMGILGSSQPTALVIAHKEAELPKEPDGLIPRVTSGFSRSVDKTKFGNSLLKEANDHFNNGIKAFDLLSADRAQGFLLMEDLKTIVRSVSGLLWGAVSGEDEIDVLREALQFLIKDQSFSLSYKDETYQALNKKVSADIDILIAGHTHLEREIPRLDGKGIYYNTGTWARLMQITAENLDPAKFEEMVYRPVKANSLDALDKAGLTINKRSVVAILLLENNKVTAELTHLKMGKSGAFLTPVSKTPFTKKQ